MFPLVQDSYIHSTADDFPFSQSIPSVTEQPLSSTQDVTISTRSRSSPTHTPPVHESFPVAINEEAQHDDNPVEMREVEPVQIREVPVRLPNYPAFHYNSQNLYEGARVGAMSATCLHCNAKKWPTEPPGMCCANGKVDVPLLGPPPEPLRAFLTNNTPPAREFRKNIRTYNSCFVMTSFQAHTVVEPGFMPTFRVQEQIYHNIGPLTPAAEEQPQFVQVYFIDDRGQQADARLAWQIDRDSQLNRHTTLCLQDMLHEHNEHVRIFKTALDQRTPDMPDYRVVIRADRVPQGQHQRTFNAPSGNDVAAILPEGQDGYRDIVLSNRDDTIKRITEIHRSYDSLQYPLLFPRGEDGYTILCRQKDPKTNQITEKKMSMLQFYAFRIMQRDGDFNILLRAGELSHQFIVDVFANIETDRLNLLRTKQEQLRAASYTALRDAVETDGDVRDVGQLVVLPSSFTGGPRYMHEKCQDAMTYVKHHGAPDLFITMTCNQNWPEITSELLPGQTPKDRHDLIARVFESSKVHVPRGHATHLRHQTLPRLHDRVAKAQPTSRTLSLLDGRKNSSRSNRQHHKRRTSRPQRRPRTLRNYNQAHDPRTLRPTQYQISLHERRPMHQTLSKRVLARDHHISQRLSSIPTSISRRRRSRNDHRQISR